jgi:hypothetical protein
LIVSWAHVSIERFPAERLMRIIGLGDARIDGAIVFFSRIRFRPGELRDRLFVPKRDHRLDGHR